jgi:hypothetical protein
MSDVSLQPVEILLTPGQVALLDDFQRTEGLPSQEAALKLLLEIAFETVTSTGNRFWDRPAAPGNEPPRR